MSTGNEILEEYASAISSRHQSLFRDERSMKMVTKIHLGKNARILAADGRQIGSLERVVLNPGSHAITDIVIRTGTLMSHEEKVVPLGLVAETTKDLVVLREEAPDLDVMPPFEERHIVDEKGDLDKPPQSAPVIYGVPGVGLAITPEPAEQFITQLQQNIPDGTVAMKEGAHVITSEGKQVGNVESVLADPTADQVTDLVVSSGLLSKESKLIPVKWIVTFGEEAIHLRVDKATVDQLAEAPLAV
jgi:uncharacterized protein YrrD